MDDFRHLNKTTNGGSSSAEQRVGAAAAAAATVAAGDSKHWPQAVRELKGVDDPRRYPTCKSTMRFLSRTAGSRARRLPSHRAPAFARADLPHQPVLVPVQSSGTCPSAARRASVLTCIWTIDDDVNESAASCRCSDA